MTRSPAEPQKAPNAFCWGSLPTLGQGPADFQMQLPPDFLGTKREVGLGLTVSSSLGSVCNNYRIAATVRKWPCKTTQELLSSPVLRPNKCRNQKTHRKTSVAEGSCSGAGLIRSGAADLGTQGRGYTRTYKKQPGEHYQPGELRPEQAKRAWRSSSRRRASSPYQLKR